MNWTPVLLVWAFASVAMAVVLVVLICQYSRLLRDLSSKEQERHDTVMDRLRYEKLYAAMTQQHAESCGKLHEAIGGLNRRLPIDETRVRRSPAVVRFAIPEDPAGFYFDPVADPRPREIGLNTEDVQVQTYALRVRFYVPRNQPAGVADGIVRSCLMARGAELFANAIQSRLDEQRREGEG